MLREAGGSHPSAALVELFPLCFLGVFVAPSSGAGRSLSFTPTWLWLHRQIVFRTLHDCRVGLGMVPLGVGFPWKICHPENHVFPWCHRSDTVPSGGLISLMCLLCFSPQVVELRSHLDTLLGEQL